MDKRTIEELTNAELLSAEMQNIFLRKLELMAATAKAYRTDESPVSGGKLAELIKSMEQATEEAGANKLVSVLPILIELVANSLVELMADNNRRLLEAVSKV